MNKLISIVGLTSSGKSDLGISLAKKFNGEIVSADSRQVYAKLDYCTGKVTKDEQTEVKHHLIDVSKLGSQYTLYDYQKAAYAAIDDIISRNKIPFLVGGTGLYSRAIVEGYNLSEDKPNSDLREELSKLSLNEIIKLCKEKNIEVGTEPTARRLIRKLEIRLENKKPNEPRYKVLQIGIYFSREEIIKRIEKRLKARLPKMIEEIKTLLDEGESLEFIKSLGLEAKCTADYVCGNYASVDEFYNDLLIKERQFAKRQQTWYKKERNTIWLDAEKLGNGGLVAEASKLIEEFLKS